MAKVLPTMLGGMIALLAACDKPGSSEDILKDYEIVPSSRAVTRTQPVPAPTAPVSASAAPPASGSVAAAGSAPPAASSSAAASASAAGSAAAPAAKVYECGSKGKPDCPMQRWMKGVAGGAVASGEADKIARAFETMGGRAPAGMRNWAAISAAGAAKARADDIDGAKQECKKCHDQNMRSYRATMRDLKWP